MIEQKNLFDALIDAFYQSLRKREFDQIDSVIERLKTGQSDQLQYPLWADYFSGIVAEERDRDWAAAQRHYNRVLASDADLILRAHVLLSLSIAYDKQARWTESVQACQESATAWATLGYPVRRAIVTRQIAISYRSGYVAGEFDVAVLKKAAQYCHDAVTIFQEHLSLPPEIVFYTPNVTLYLAITWLELGNIEVAAGNWAKAIEYFQQLLTLWQESNDRYHAAFAYRDLGDAYQMVGAGNWQQAEQMYQQALIHIQDYNDAYFLFNLYASLGSLHLRQENLPSANDYYQKSLAMIENLRAGVSSEDARSGFFATVVNVYANAVLAQIKAQEYEKAFDLMERARARAFLDSLTIANNEYAKRIDTKPLPLRDLQALLPPDAILLEYYTTGLLASSGRRVREEQAAKNVLYPTAKTLLFAITQDQIAVYDLELSPNTLFTSDLTQFVEERFLSPHLRSSLYEKFLAPASTLLYNKQRLYVIPHGPLHYVPFHALIASDGDTLLRKDGPEIVYAPSAAILFRPLRKQEKPMTETCLAIGYNGEVGRQLHFAEEEAIYIANMAGGTALVGAHPKKALLYQQAANYQSLHFSCHGEFDPEMPLESLLHIGPGETLTSREIIDNLRLNCDLVILSACESGLSKVQGGDELYGMIRAFMYAGAPVVIATLWRVDERSTLIFAEKFYQLVQQGEAYATALTAAQLYLKNLTRKAALEVLTRHITQTTDAPLPDLLTLLQADKYLKSLAVVDGRQPNTITSNISLPTQLDDDKIFADPKFWAPFILIGDPRIQRADRTTIATIG